MRHDDTFRFDVPGREWKRLPGMCLKTYAACCVRSLSYVFPTCLSFLSHFPVFAEHARPCRCRTFVCGRCVGCFLSFRSSDCPCTVLRHRILFVSLLFQTMLRRQAEDFRQEDSYGRKQDDKGRHHAGRRQRHRTGGHYQNPCGPADERTVRPGGVRLFQGVLILSEGIARRRDLFVSDNGKRA